MSLTTNECVLNTIDSKIAVQIKHTFTHFYPPTSTQWPNNFACGIPPFRDYIPLGAPHVMSTSEVLF